MDLLSRPHDEAARRVCMKLADRAATFESDGHFVAEGAQATAHLDAWWALDDALAVFAVSIADKRVERERRKLQECADALRPVAEAEQLASWVEARVGAVSAPAAQGFLRAERKVHRKAVARAQRRATRVAERLLERLALHRTTLGGPAPSTFGQVLGGYVRALAADAAAALFEQDLEAAVPPLRRLALVASITPELTEAATLRRTAMHGYGAVRRPFDPVLARKVLLGAGLVLDDDAAAALDSALARTLPRRFGTTLVQQADRAARLLEGSAQRETERKYLLSGLPEAVEGAPVKTLAQGYLPGRALRERLRRVERDGSVKFLRTIKFGRGVTRVEIEEETTESLFDAMWPLTKGCRVQKQRYSVADGALTWVIDAFTDRELVLAEVELPSEEIDPPIPGWLAPHLVREVTNESQFVNVNLAR